MSDEYQPRTPERLIEILISEGRNPRAWQSEAADTIERLLRALTGIAEYCSGEDQTLGAIKRLVAIRNTAEQAIHGHQQETKL